MSNQRGFTAFEFVFAIAGLSIVALGIWWFVTLVFYPEVIGAWIGRIATGINGAMK